MAHYLCGMINQNDDSVVLAESWSDDVYSYEGFDKGIYPTYGCKGKQNYQNQFFFFAFEGDPSEPDVVYLVKASLLPDNTIELKYAPIPEVVYEELSFVVKPNQLTIDKNGYVFFPAGRFVVDDMNSAIVFGVDVSDDDPDNWVFTWLDTGIDTISGALGIALNKSHTKMMTYCAASGPEIDLDKVLIFDNDGDGTVSFNSAFNLAGWTVESPFCDNIETDVSGFTGDGWSYFCLHQWDIIVSFNMDTMSVAYTFDTLGQVLAVDAFGYVTTMIRINTCPMLPNPIYYYLPVGGGSLVYLGLINMSCPHSKLTHHDHCHTDPLYVYESSGLEDDTGEIRRGASTTVYSLSDYRKICVECPREGHT